MIDIKRKFWLLNGGGSSIDAGYQAILDKGTALGYTLPSAAQQTKQNTLYVALKPYLSNFDLMYVLANDVASGFWKINWCNPATFPVVESGTLRRTNNVGYDSNSSAYGNTNWTPSINGVKYALNDASVLFYVGNNVAENKYICGTIGGGGTGESRFAPKWSDNNFYGTQNSASGSYNTYANATSIGFYQHIRLASNSTKLYKDGVQVDAEANVSTSLSNNFFFLCSPSGAAGGTQQLGFCAVGAGNEANAAAIYAAWNAYFTSL